MYLDVYLPTNTSIGLSGARTIPILFHRRTRAIATVALVPPSSLVVFNHRRQASLTSMPPSMTPLSMQLGPHGFVKAANRHDRTSDTACGHSSFLFCKKPHAKERCKRWVWESLAVWIIPNLSVQRRLYTLDSYTCIILYSFTFRFWRVPVIHRGVGSKPLECEKRTNLYVPNPQLPRVRTLGTNSGEISPPSKQD